LETNERVKIDCFREILIDAESCRVHAVLILLKITAHKKIKNMIKPYHDRNINLRKGRL
jgi:hypothetical protein